MEQKKFYQQQWFMWLLLILFPPIGIIFMWVTKKDFKVSKKILLTCLGLFWWLIFHALRTSGNKNSNGGAQTDYSKSSTETTTTEITTTETTTTEAVPILEAFEIELSAGQYTAGIDFPSGAYSITCISGSGNVLSTNMYSGGLNEIMAVDTSDGFSIDTFNNARFNNGDILSVTSTAVITLSSDGVDKNSLSERSPSGTEIELSSGNYIAGTDFEPGVYVVTCISGSGNVNSTNLYNGGLNEIMSTDASDGFSITTFTNASFEEGDELKISGCSVKLTPSK